MEMMPVHNPLGRPLKFKPQELAEKFAEYAQWCHDHPFFDENRVEYANGNFAASESPKPRRISIGGFLAYLGTDFDWWGRLDIRQDGEDFVKVKRYIKNYCETSQSDMASAGLLKENIISRLLGLADKQAVDAKVDGKMEYKFKFGE